MPSSSATNPVVAVIVQARLGSSRLPGKILEPLVDDVTVLGFLLERLRQCRTVQHVLVATSTSPTDDRLVEWLRLHDWQYVRGSEEDCLSRFGVAAQAAEADVLIRITADCPLVVPEVVDAMVDYYLRNLSYIDYLSNRQYTDFPEGVDTELFTRQMLEEAILKACEQREREHINYYFLSRHDQFRIRYYNHGLGDDFSRFKLSIDTRDDLERVRRYFAEFGLPKDFSLAQLLDVLSKGERSAMVPVCKLI